MSEPETVEIVNLVERARKSLATPVRDASRTELMAVANEVAPKDFELYESILDGLEALQRAPRVPEISGGTLAELMVKEIEPIRWVVDGLIPEGLTILAGKPKLGKSWLALAVSLSICAGEEALGHHTDKAEVLYVALEDGERRLQDRVRILGGENHSNGALSRFHYRTLWPSLDQGGLAALEEWMGKHADTRLVVVDTYGKMRGDLPGKDRYQEEYAVLGALQTFATTHRCAVLLVHHLRKQGADDWLEQLSGTQAITGSADTLLGLFRERGVMDATLRLVSREIDEKDLALRFDGGRWESMGDAALYRTTTERLEILNAIQDLGGEAKAHDIASLIDKRSNTVTRLLLNLEKERLVRKVRYGVYELTAEAVGVMAVDPQGVSLDPPHSDHTSELPVSIDPPQSSHTPPTTITTITTMRGGTKEGTSAGEVTSPCLQCHHPVVGAHLFNCPTLGDSW